MDPDVLLEKILNHVTVVQNSTSSATRATHGEWLADAVAKLHEWLLRGGLLPGHWTRARDREVVAALKLADDAVLPQRSPDEVAARRAARANADPTDDVTAIQRELDAHPTWSDAGVRDAVARVVAATPDDLLEDLEEHYDDPAGGVAAPDDLLERYTEDDRHPPYPHVERDA